MAPRAPKITVSNLEPILVNWLPALACLAVLRKTTIRANGAPEIMTYEKTTMPGSFRVASSELFKQVGSKD
jgi:hypothetical protein